VPRGTPKPKAWESPRTRMRKTPAGFSRGNSRSRKPPELLASSMAWPVLLDTARGPGQRDTPRASSKGGVPRGPHASRWAEGILAVGVSAGQVKPTSGGGIYPGLVCARIAGKVAASAAREGDASATRLSEYERRWRSELGRELRLGMIVHRMRACMNDRELDDLVRLLADRDDLIRMIEEEGDIARPSRAIKKAAPRMGLFGLSMVKILLRNYRTLK